MRMLSEPFLDDLLKGMLRPLLDHVRADTSLDLQIRDNYINVYYRGGSLLKVEPKGTGYRATFNQNYAKKNEKIPASSLALADSKSESGTQAWCKKIPLLKLAMDHSTQKKPSEEKEVQQLLVRENNYGAIANSTDFYVTDIEAAHGRSRFDMVGVRWRSTPAVRKQADGHRLFFAEVKCGENALKGTAGLKKHILDVDALAGNPGKLDDLKMTTVAIFNQKLRLKLLKCGKRLGPLGNEPPLLLIILANHDPDSTLLRALLGELPEPKHVELRFAVSNFLGYGLYDPGILTLEELRSRFPNGI